MRAEAFVCVLEVARARTKLVSVLFVLHGKHKCRTPHPVSHHSARRKRRRISEDSGGRQEALFLFHSSKRRGTDVRAKHEPEKTPLLGRGQSFCDAFN